MSYQLSIILGTAISLRKFRRALFGLDICLVPLLFFPCDGDLPLLQRGKRSQPEKGKVRRTVECPGSVIDYFHARRSTRRERRRRVSLFESLLNASGSLASTEMPLRFPGGCGKREKERMLSRGNFEEKSRIIGLTLIASA